MATLYDLKPAFQGLLRPLTARLARAGVTANQVTLAGAAISVAAGAAVALAPDAAWPFFLLPAVLFARMALNAIDGMLAREHGMVSALGHYLNEIGDVVSDAAVILPFALIAPFEPWGVVAFALAAALCEFAGVLGLGVGAGRIYAGPFGKSDRAFAIGLISVLAGLGVSLPFWGAWLFPLLALLSLATVFNRARAGLAAARHPETEG